VNKIQFDWHLESGVASLGNLILLLVALFSFPYILYRTDALALMSIDPSSPQHKAAVIRFCVVVTAYLWVLFCIALGGIGTSSRCTYGDVIGKAWDGWSDFYRDLGISALVLAALYAIGQLSIRLIPPSQLDAAAFRSMVPQKVEEALAFLIVGLSAGFVEEFVFRGYLQKQLQALFGNTLLASVVQVALFTQGHLYQGMARLIPVALIGAVLTAVALWRKSLIPGMIAHGVGDSLTAIVYFVQRLIPM
jgi:membrane protease YdiL (CAAX protease family)